MSAGSEFADWYLQTIRANDAVSEMGLVLISKGEAPLIVEGQIEGPVCEYSTTLPAFYPWRSAPVRQKKENVTAARVTVEESCLWEPAHPFLYRGTWKANDTQMPVRFGWRVLQLRDGRLVVNGKPTTVQGLSFPTADQTTLEKLHEIGANFIALGQGEWLPEMDEFGPFCVASLPQSDVLAAKAVKSGPQKPSIGVWVVPQDWEEETVRQVRKRDKTTVFARRSSNEDNELRGTDLLLVDTDPSSLEERSSKIQVPWLAMVSQEAKLSEMTPENWQTLVETWDSRLSHFPECVGWILSGT